jgi:hypothetical protein
VQLYNTGSFHGLAGYNAGKQSLRWIRRAAHAPEVPGSASPYYPGSSSSKMITLLLMQTHGYLRLNRAINLTEVSNGFVVVHAV